MARFDPFFAGLADAARAAQERGAHFAGLRTEARTIAQRHTAPNEIRLHNGVQYWVGELNGGQRVLVRGQRDIVSDLSGVSPGVTGYWSKERPQWVSVASTLHEATPEAMVAFGREISEVRRTFGLMGPATERTKSIYQVRQEAQRLADTLEFADKVTVEGHVFEIGEVSLSRSYGAGSKRKVLVMDGAVISPTRPLGTLTGSDTSSTYLNRPNSGRPFMLRESNPSELSTARELLDRAIQEFGQHLASQNAQLKGRRVVAAPRSVPLPATATEEEVKAYKQIAEEIEHKLAYRRPGDQTFRQFQQSAADTLKRYPRSELPADGTGAMWRTVVEVIATAPSHTHAFLAAHSARERSEVRGEDYSEIQPYERKMRDNRRDPHRPAYSEAEHYRYQLEHVATGKFATDARTGTQFVLDYFPVPAHRSMTRETREMRRALEKIVTQKSLAVSNRIAQEALHAINQRQLGGADRGVLV